MSFEFEAFERPRDGQDNNMENIMEKVNNFSIDWQNFDAPNDDPGQVSESDVSKMFNQSKKSEKQSSNQREFENSRDLMEISLVNPQNNMEQSFRFETQDQSTPTQSNSRFERLQYLLNHAKSSSTDFYKNLQRERNAYDEENKFKDYPEFKEHMKDLKRNKRETEQVISQKLTNQNKVKSFFGEQKQPKGFAKKSTGNLLPAQFASEDYFQHQFQSQQKKNPTKNFNNFYEGEKLPEQIPQHNDLQDAEKFFDFNESPKKNKQDKDKWENLDPIREQRFNSFEKTVEEEKLNKLLMNYKDMRQNFQSLITELKETNEDKEKIVEQLKKIKQSKIEQEIEEERKYKRQRREKQTEYKHQKLNEIQEEINKIGSNEKDILYLKINEKIQHLEDVVKRALEEVHEEKEQKTRPKVINYYQYQENGSYREDSRSESEKASSRRSKQIFQKSQNYQNSQDYGYDEGLGMSRKSTKNNNQHQQIIPSSDKVNSRKKDEVNDSVQASGRRSQNTSVFSQSRNKINQYCSPLDLHLDSLCNENMEVFEEPFVPAEFGREYLPKEMVIQNKHLKSGLSQKSSVVYESFDFHISTRFTMMDDEIHPIVAYLRMGNKCSIDLMDIHVLVYGPHGPSIITDPNQIFMEKMKKSSNFSFQVFINKSCIDENCFSIQISYKTDSMSKKKINFKVPLPILQLLRPQFVYEDKFRNDWSSLTNQLFIRPKRLNFNELRSHEDLKLYLPFIDLAEMDPDVFSYGLVFRYPKIENTFFIKLQCYVNGSAALQMRSLKSGNQKFKEYFLDVLNFIFFTLG